MINTKHRRHSESLIDRVERNNHTGQNSSYNDDTNIKKTLDKRSRNRQMQQFHMQY